MAGDLTHQIQKAEIAWDSDKNLSQILSGIIGWVLMYSSFEPSTGNHKSHLSDWSDRDFQRKIHSTVPGCVIVE
ncbi:uncharacterized protein RAG0_00603 [Rhynchosporium agropyri]|uniref:Uncharacterized protein n=1 Tax=Rhynchosporium agropyri TaxID=914238 RepID=A0A1E1JTG2_9HELO|nr:uncharacterized protein RAG0_00603 [Rhynchosporium agropyri]